MTIVDLFLFFSDHFH